MDFEFNEERKYTPLEELRAGDTFIETSDFDENQVFMVIDRKGWDCHIEFNKENEEEEENELVTVVDLSNGSIWTLNKSTYVLKVKCDRVTVRVD